MTETCAVDGCQGWAPVLLCLDHAKKLHDARTATNSAVPASPPRIKSCSRCEAPGDLYPGGRYCRQHLPASLAFVPKRREPDYVAPELKAPDPAIFRHPCPDDKLPTSIRTALKLAQANGWKATATYAVGPPPALVHSVVFRAARNKIYLRSRHEGNDGIRWTFKTAWYQDGLTMPTQIGWRELTTELQKQPTRLHLPGELESV